MSSGAFTPEFTPVARVGHLVELDRGEDGKQTWRVERMSHPTEVVIDLPEVGAGEEEQTELEDLKLWRNWLGQFRMLKFRDELPDDVTIQADLGGRSSPIWTLKNVRGNIDQQTGAVAAHDFDGGGEATEVQYTHITELFTFHDTVPWFTITNSSGSPVDFDITFTGFIYRLRQQAATDQQPIYIPVESVRGG